MKIDKKKKNNRYERRKLGGSPIENAFERLFNDDLMQSGPKKSPKVHTSGKYRGGVRTCAQVCLASPPHPALAPPLLTPPTAGFRIPASQTSPRRLLRRLASAPSTSSSASSSWWSSRRRKSRRPGSRGRSSIPARTPREYIKSAIVRAHLAHSRVPRNLARSAP